MTSRACWITVGTIIWALAMAGGLLFGADSVWRSGTYDLLRPVPRLAWAGWFLLVAALGLAGIVAHHAGRAYLAMHLSRGMALAAVGVTAIWWAAFVVGWATGTLAGWSALASWFFHGWVFLEATGMGGVRRAPER